MRSSHTSKQRTGILNSLFAIELPVTSDLDIKEIAQEYGFVSILGCTRKVMFGIGAPPQELSEFSVCKGKEAYALLLQYQAGLLSRSPGETQIVGQFREAFRIQESFENNTLQDYGKLRQWLTEDNDAVRHHVTHDLQSAHFETVAQRVAGRVPNESVLLVIDEDSKGNLSETTLNMLRQLGSVSDSRPSAIVITHPDDAVVRRHMYEIQRMSERGTIAPEVSSVKFDEVLSTTYDSDLFKKVRCTYFCPACNSFPEAEANLMDWHNQAAAFGAKMVLLGGDKKHRKTAGVWAGDHFNLILPEQIVDAQKTKKAENAGLISRGKQACLNCAESRDLGKKPLSRSLVLPQSEYIRLHGASTNRYLG